MKERKVCECCQSRCARCGKDFCLDADTHLVDADGEVFCGRCAKAAMALANDPSDDGLEHNFMCEKSDGESRE